jgi:hypothetical protein
MRAGIQALLRSNDHPPHGEHQNRNSQHGSGEQGEAPPPAWYIIHLIQTFGTVA